MSTASGFIVWWLTLQPGVVHWIQSLPFAKPLGMIENASDKPILHEPWQIVIYLMAAAFAGIIASLLTKSPNEAKVNQFHQLIRTPVQPGEVITTSCQLPAGVQPLHRATWFTGSNFEVPVPSKTSVVGFFVSCAAVGAMIGGFIWLMWA